MLYTVCVIVSAVSMLNSADVRRLEWGAMTVGFISGKAEAVTVKFCQAEDRTTSVSVGDHVREGGVLEIPSHRSTRESLPVLDGNIYLIRLGY